jgi:hypothetical protein
VTHIDLDISQDRDMYGLRYLQREDMSSPGNYEFNYPDDDFSGQDELTEAYPSVISGGTSQFLVFLRNPENRHTSRNLNYIPHKCSHYCNLPPPQPLPKYRLYSKCVLPGPGGARRTYGLTSSVMERHIPDGVEFYWKSPRSCVSAGS